MKKTVLLAVFTFMGHLLVAQPWMPVGKGPVKLQDVIDNYKKNPANGHDDDEEKTAGGVEKEGKDYLFGRWAWFWKEHLDANGNMVAPSKTFTEWEAYKNRVSTGRYAGKTTASTPPSPNWVFQGPGSSLGGYSGIGRINVVAFHPTDPNTIYIGSAGGGTWKSTDNGNSWAPLYNTLTNMGVSDIKINPLNANTVYICTGDADGYDEYSIGVIKSNDAGATWQTTGLTWTPTEYELARSLLINPLDTSELTLATTVGIYKSMDAGATWTNVYGGNFEQILYNPADTSIMYATNYTGGSSQILRSHDGGFTWTTVTSLSSSIRINIAVTPANPAIVKAISSTSAYALDAIYGSTDSGASYTPIFANTGCEGNLIGYNLGLPTSTCDGQGWYDLCIAIDPSNANNVIVGGINNYYSTDGGNSWAFCSQWYSSLPGVATVHADKHCLAYNPLVPGALYQGCDGGVYETLDPLSLLWNDLTNGLGITEFYRSAVADGVPFCLGGAQDNGTKMINNGVFTDITGGDGCQCQIDYDAPTTTWYTSFPQGSFDITFNGGIAFTSITPPSAPTGDWVTPFIIHPLVDNVVLAGYNQLYVSYDQGSTWSTISPVYSNNINSIVVPLTNGNDIYTATDDNVIQFSPDFGVTWHNIYLPYSGNISRLAADPKNENILWVTFSGYGTHKVASYNNTTTTWTVEDGTLPDVPVNCIIIDSSTSTKYIGTEVAVFYRDTTMTDWALYNTNLPAVIVNDLNINYATSQVWAATFGRGMWATQKYVDSTAPPANTGVAQLNTQAGNALLILPNPNHGNFTISSAGLAGQTVHISLLSADGNTAWQQDMTFDKSGNVKVSVPSLAKGTYICQAENSGVVQKGKVVIY